MLLVTAFEGSATRTKFSEMSLANRMVFGLSVGNTSFRSPYKWTSGNMVIILYMF